MRLFYDQRKKHGLGITVSSRTIPTDEITDLDVWRVFEQLVARRLVDQFSGVAETKRQHDSDGEYWTLRLGGKISAEGVEIIEGEGLTSLRPQTPVSTQTVNIHGSQNIQVGNQNSMMVNVQQHLQQLHQIIEQMEVPAKEKEEAKGLIAKVLENPILAGMAGPAFEVWLRGHGYGA